MACTCWALVEDAWLLVSGRVEGLWSSRETGWKENTWRCASHSAISDGFHELEMSFVVFGIQTGSVTLQAIAARFPVGGTGGDPATATDTPSNSRLELREQLSVG